MYVYCPFSFIFKKSVCSCFICTGSFPYDILLSYVHKEASEEALLLWEALQDDGYRVFLDRECIYSGSDWHDVLNDAISKCSLFVPLITSVYGQVCTPWREGMEREEGEGREGGREGGKREGGREEGKG